MMLSAQEETPAQTELDSVQTDLKEDGIIIQDSIIKKETYINPLAPSRAAFYSAVLPGLVLTERGHWAKVLKTRPQHATKYLKERTTLGRFGTPDEISPIVVLMCSELASFCIGSIIPVEGGQARHYFQKVDDF